MIYKSAALLIAIGVLALAAPALGSMQIVPLWQHNVSLDFGGKAVTVEPLAPSSDNINRIMRQTLFRGDNASDWGGIYLFEERQGTELDGPDDLLWGLMKGSCKGVSINPGTVSGQLGRVGKGYARVEHGFGHECWGGIIRINMAATGTTQYFAIIGHFSNESLNQQFVKTAVFY
jgi:hypothetical protein